MISELENSWRNIIQLIALKSETGHTYMHTYIHGWGAVGELLDNYWIIILDFAASNLEITNYPLRSLAMSRTNVGEFFGS